MSSVLLSDPTKSYFKLSLWREAATWAERIAIGDFVLFKSNLFGMMWCGVSVCESDVLYRCEDQDVEG